MSNNTSSRVGNLFEREIENMVRATRSAARRQGYNPADLTGEQALYVLDDAAGVLRHEGNIFALQYFRANERDFARFKKIWDGWRNA